MPFNFLEIFRPKKTGTVTTKKVECSELWGAAREYRIRELCFWVCVNMVATAFGRCEIKTYLNGKEAKGEEYWTWNIEPNQNQNATAFIHELVARLHQDNEALIVDAKEGGLGGIVVADSFSLDEDMPQRENVYRDVSIGTETRREVMERDALHLTLHHKNMAGVLQGLYDSFARLINAAVKSYEYNGGQHWKVHVSQLAQGKEGWLQEFQKMIEEQIKPFLTSSSAILPEFDGYKYENVDNQNSRKQADSSDLRNLTEDIFNYTARAFLIPAVLVNGKIEGTEDANTRFLTNCIDPLADQLQEEINRKRYGFERWQRGDYVKIDTSSIIHFDMFANAANVEKLIGSGAYSINDVREAAGQSQIDAEWADQHFLTLNITTMAAAMEKAEEGR